MSCPHSDDGDACAICKQEGEDGEEYIFLTCTHKFHRYCIDEYAACLKQHEGEDAIIKCPICKEGRIPNERDDELVGALWGLVLGRGSSGTLVDEDPRVTNKVMSVNYGGLVNVATAALPPMLERGYGDFISFSSMTGIIPGLLMGAYASSKAAVQHYSEILYHENRDSGLRFCCVCPPAVATPLWRQAEATVVPKLPARGETLTPDQVIAEVERCLEGGKPFAFPGKQTKFGVLMRRLFPGLVWKASHEAEGF